MTSSTIATWAEPMRWTADDLLRLSDVGFRFELVKGELVRMAPTGGSLGLRTGRLHGVLSGYVGTRGLGEVAASETGFDLTQPGDAAQTIEAPTLAREDEPASPAAIQASPGLRAGTESATPM